MRTQPETNGQSLFTCEVTIHRAANVPVSDLNNISCDPYFYVTLLTQQSGPSSSESVPQALTYRTHTARRTLNPTFNARWIISEIPSEGFILTLSLIDEDPGNRDDYLGKAELRFPFIGQSLYEGWDSGEKEYKVHKRKGSVRSKLATLIAKTVTRGEVGHRARVWVSVKVVGKAKDQKDTRIYTVGPHRYVQHFSPLIGSFLGSTKAPNSDRTNSSLKASTFVANRIQLSGPVPESLRHRYVDFAPFVTAMFMRKGIKGIILHRALHRQHLSIYKWDKNVIVGVVEDDIKENSGGRDHDHDVDVDVGQRANGHANVNGNVLPRTGKKETDVAIALARQFLQMTSHGTHGRIFTYVIMLDGEWRFTETGKNFAIEFLSKHTMHSDISIEIAYSGEFFVRKLRQNHHTSNHEDNDDHETQPPDDPSAYELVIDNDSGTYRPRKHLLPTLQTYLSSPSNLSALGKITAMDGFDEELKKWKEERVNIKNGKQTVVQARVSGSSSRLSASSLGSEEGLGRQLGRSGRVGSGEVEAAFQEDAEKARNDEDEDRRAKGEGESGTEKSG